MKNQLQLIDTPISWRLDDHTKEVGREGLRLARTKLRAARVLDAESTPAAEATASNEIAEHTESSIPKAA